MDFLELLTSSFISFNAWTNHKNLLIEHTQGNSHYKALDKMLNLGCSANCTDYYGISALMHSAHHGNSANYCTLRNHGAEGDIKCRLQGKTVLHFASRPSMASARLFRSKDLRLENGNYHSTIDQDADHVNVINLICEDYPQILNVKDKEGRTAVMGAVGIPRHLKALLSYNPDLSIRNKSGLTAFEIAEKYKYLESFKLLKAKLA